ncbi:hypothetical protein OJAV_G00174780 [Oryzias javanicus]|uniref:ZP domain-containing protein n=1 Tax=Oryzias javanicus TaxID=123683 RepID=A0A437CGT3_ORYJA|nr:hypothetical protein OJAV_G00174780 [Oryzias javanicus]
MATGGGGGGRCKKWQTLAGVLLVSFLAISALYLSLHGQTNVAQRGDSKESSAVEVAKGSIFFDLKPSDNLCSSSGESDEMVKTDLIGMDHGIKEAEWRLLNASLQCGQTKMKLVVEGPGAADLELYFGDSCSLPLSQVPQMCGFLTKGNATSLTLIVDYDGCNVKQENGSFVLFLGWRKTPIKLACAVLPSPDTTIPSTSEPVKQFLEPAVPPKLRPLRRTKRFFKDPYSTAHNDDEKPTPKSQCLAQASPSSLRS